MMTILMVSDKPEYEQKQQKTEIEVWQEEFDRSPLDDSGIASIAGYDQPYVNAILQQYRPK